MKRGLILAAALLMGASDATANEGAAERVLVVRERHSAELLDGAFTFDVLKIRGYSIDIRVDSEKRLLRIGQSFSPEGHSCTVTFKKISPETRIARFVTDCPAKAESS